MLFRIYKKAHFVEMFNLGYIGHLLWYRDFEMKFLFRTENTTNYFWYLNTPEA